MASFYSVYHGPEGLTRIAERVHGMATSTAQALAGAGYKIESMNFFDTFKVDVSAKGVTSAQIQSKCAAAGVNVRIIDAKHVGVSFGEAITRPDVEKLLSGFSVDPKTLNGSPKSTLPKDLVRASSFMTHPVFNTYKSETQMLRYMKSLENKDLSLNYSMISLGSCTMKLNASVEMFPVTWPETCNLHPFAPADQVTGYKEMIESLNRDLAEITGFAAVSAQPNSGAQGEYAGLLCIRAYHRSRGDHHRDICLIPISAHGTNPASASMCGMTVVVVKSDDSGNIDIKDLKEKALKHKDKLAALMLTYPSTYGVFEEEVKNIIDTVHGYGGQVYMDGNDIIFYSL